MLIKKTFCVRSKVVVLFLLVIHCLLLLQLFEGGFVFGSCAVHSVLSSLQSSR